MKKLTSTQIKGLSKNESVSYTLENGFMFEVYKNIKSLADLDFVPILTEQIIFIDNEYCPQYYEVVTNIAWLKVFTNIPLVTKKVKETNANGNEKEFEIIDYEINYKIARNIIDFVCSKTDKCASCYFDSLVMIENIVDCYIKDKLSSKNSYFEIKLNSLTSECEEGIKIINKVSEKLDELFGNDKMLSSIKEVANQVSTLNSNIKNSSNKEVLKPFI